jgi:hypothetical protein
MAYQPANPQAFLAKQHRLLHAHRNRSWYKAFHPVSETEETSMQHRFKERCAPETLNLFALIAVMALFAGGLFYAGEYLSAPRQTAQLVVPNLNP